MDSVQLLTAVNAFYDQAFNRLIIVTFGLMAFMGVLIPVVVGWIQMRTLRTEKDSIMRDLKSEIKVEREDIRQTIEGSVRDEMAQVRADLEKRIEELSRELKTSSATAEARSFHLQGVQHIRSSTPFMGVGDFTHAACRYLDANDESNAQKCITVVIRDCLPRAGKIEYKKYKLDKYCEELLVKLRGFDENGRYYNSITEIEKEMEAALNREGPRTA